MEPKISATPFIFLSGRITEEDQIHHLNTGVDAAKTTINTRIDIMVKNNVFEKIFNLSDGRRRELILSSKFRNTLDAHISNNIEKLIDVINEH